MNSILSFHEMCIKIWTQRDSNILALYGCLISFNTIQDYNMKGKTSRCENCDSYLKKLLSRTQIMLNRAVRLVIWNRSLISSTPPGSSHIYIQVKHTMMKNKSHAQLINEEIHLIGIMIDPNISQDISYHLIAFINCILVPILLLCNIVHVLISLIMYVCYVWRLLLHDSLDI